MIFIHKYRRSRVCMLCCIIPMICIALWITNILAYFLFASRLNNMDIFKTSKGKTLSNHLYFKRLSFKQTTNSRQDTMSYFKRKLIGDHFYGTYVSSEWQGQLNNKSEATLVNPHDFQYILNNELLCESYQNVVITLIHSAPLNFRNRDIIRKTWGNDDIVLGIRHIKVFLLGGVENKTTQNQIEEEFEMYQDLIQEDFTDSYYNLTYKNIMGLKWVTLFCSNAQYMVKCDDDIIINIRQLFNTLKVMTARGINTSVLLCNYFEKDVRKVVRHNGTKWTIGTDKYKDKYYPAMCPGMSYIMSLDVTHRLYLQSLRTPFFSLDDVYVTGILRFLIDVAIRDFSSAYTNYEFVTLRYQKALNYAAIFFVEIPCCDSTVIWRRIWRVVKTKDIKAIYIF